MLTLNSKRLTEKGTVVSYSLAHDMMVIYDYMKILFVGGFICICGKCAEINVNTQQ